jgi:hypothetical protein
LPTSTVATSDSSTGTPLLGRQDDAADVVEAADQADALHHRRWAADADGARADRGVAGPDRVDHLRQGKAVRVQARQVDHHRIGLGAPAEAGDVHHAGHALEAAVQHPFLQRLQLVHREAGRAHDPVAHDLADRAQRADGGLGALGQAAQHGQAVEHLLQRLLVGVGEGELHPHVDSRTGWWSGWS